MTNSEARRQLGSTMPTGEYRLSEVVVETRSNESDWEQDAWIAVENSQQLWSIVQGWARK